MKLSTPTVLLGPVGRDCAGLQAALGVYGAVLAPELTQPEHAVTLEEPALSVLAAISGAGAEAAGLCGIGLGAMVALKVAAGFGPRVTGLVLSTARTPESTAMLSIGYGVRGLISAATAQRLGAAPAQVLGLLDEVRPIDYRGWVREISTATLVLVGDRDAANLGPSMRLVGTLPRARLQSVARMSAGWINAQPDRYAGLVAEFFASV